MRFAKLLVVALLFLFAAACGGSADGNGLLGGSSQSSTNIQTNSQSSSTSAAGSAGSLGAGSHAATAGSAVGNNTKSPSTGANSKPVDSSNAASGDTFRSSASGYSIQYPRGWTAKENFATIAGITIDGFISPDLSNNFAANVNVLCEASAGGETTDAYVKANIDQLGSQKINAKDTGTAQTGIGAGHLLTYTTSFGGQSVDLAQIILTDKRCGWVLTLTTTAGERDKYMKTFMAMAMSFKTTK